MNEIIHIDQLTKRFGQFTAVDQISFNVDAGEIFGFLGANGAGKTTAIRMLCGLLKPTSGTGIVAGFNIGKQSEKIKQRIGYMSQRFSLYEDLTVKENIRLYGGIYGLSRKELRFKMTHLIERLGISEIADTLVRSLPLGWRQKLAFSIAIIHDPAIVFLDEPTGGVDPVARRQFWEMIYQVASEGMTVFVTTHYMDEAEYCDRVSIMVNGKIEALDSPTNLKSNYKANTMDEVFISLARPNKNDN
jgi:ABC-2 type transport system ATP-binding protein